MTIEINNESDQKVDEARVLALASFALDQLRIHPDAELAIQFVNEDAMTTLHVQWMDEPGPTDVLSFPMDELRPDRKGCLRAGQAENLVVVEADPHHRQQFGREADEPGVAPVLAGAGLLVAPDAVAKPQIVAWHQHHHVGIVPGDPVGADRAHGIELGDAVLRRLEQLREGTSRHLTPLEAGQPLGGQQRELLALAPVD